MQAADTSCDYLLLMVSRGPMQPAKWLTLLNWLTPACLLSWHQSPALHGAAGGIRTAVMGHAQTCLHHDYRWYDLIHQSDAF